VERGLARARRDFARVGGCLYVNSACLALTAYSRRELSRMQFGDEAYSDDRVREELPFTQLSADETDHCELEKRVVRGDSAIVWVGSVSSLDRDGYGTPLQRMTMLAEVRRHSPAREALARADVDASGPPPGRRWLGA
jgi:PAS domain-containing protein